MVIGEDSCFEGRGFESRLRILDGHEIFSNLICFKKLHCLFEKTENKQKEAGIGPKKIVTISSGRRVRGERGSG